MDLVDTIRDLGIAHFVQVCPSRSRVTSSQFAIRQSILIGYGHRNLIKAPECS